MTNLIVAKQLSKEFQKYKAIENLNFTVEKGEILGFLGPQVLVKRQQSIS